jgi:hypothetical protein
MQRLVNQLFYLAEVTMSIIQNKPLGVLNFESTTVAAFSKLDEAASRGVGLKTGGARREQFVIPQLPSRSRTALN